MLTRPANVSDDNVASALQRSWHLTPASLSYEAVGFGSHHWRVRTDSGQWFVSVDDLDEKRGDDADTSAAARSRLDAALATARALQAAGLDFVVAPIPTLVGAVTAAIGNRYAVALYPWVEGESHRTLAYARADARLAVVERLVSLHRSTNAVDGIARSTDFAIPRRDHLLNLLDRGSRGTWGPGPFADRARDLLGGYSEAVRAALASYDRLAEGAGRRRRRMVITHGEPHRGNVIDSPDGPMLIDWDTALLAPPERDLWRLIDEDPDCRDTYETAAGTALDDEALTLHRLWWDLCEVALFTYDFSRHHEDTADTRTAWAGLVHHLDPSRWAHL